MNSFYGIAIGVRLQVPVARAQQANEILKGELFPIFLDLKNYCSASHSDISDDLDVPTDEDESISEEEKPEPPCVQTVAADPHSRRFPIVPILLGVLLYLLYLALFPPE